MRVFPFFAISLAAVSILHCGLDANEESLGSRHDALCAAGWNATWQQGSGANEWWVELLIGGDTVTSAYLEVPGRANVVLSKRYDKWSASSAKIPSGTMVVAHATNVSGASAQTKPFAYLTASPAADPCTSGTDAGTDAGTCSSFTPTWQQGSGANEWWAEYRIANAASASLQIVGGATVALALRYDKWSASTAKIPSGTSVILRASDAAGATAETSPFRYLVDTAPTTKPCSGDAGTDAGTDAGSPSGDPYDPNDVLDYEFTFDAAAMAILSSTNEADQDTWVHGTFKQGDTVLTDVGFRRKGSSTFRALPKKAAFKVRFDKFVKKQKWRGLTDLTLNNSMGDPTFLVERLSYHVFRSAGLPAQRAASAHVLINGENYGLYANIETPDDQLIERLFVANARTLYEINYGSQWTPNVISGFEEEEGDGSFSDVHALLNTVEATKDATLLTDVAGVLDTTEWLKFSATEAVVGHYDGYGFGKWGSHNYFMAGDPNGRFSLIPWSTDLTMSDREGGVNANLPQDTDGAPTLLGHCKKTTACWSAYKDQVRAVLAAFATLDMANLARRWHAQIDPYVTADPKRETTLSYYSSESTKLYGWLEGRPTVVRSQLGLSAGLSVPSP